MGDGCEDAGAGFVMDNQDGRDMTMLLDEQASGLLQNAMRV